MCSFCEKRSAEKMKYCSSCRSAYYCSRNCQKKHWKIHKPNCIKVDERNKNLERDYGVLKFIQQKIIPGGGLKKLWNCKSLKPIPPCPNTSTTPPRCIGIFHLIGMAHSYMGTSLRYEPLQLNFFYNVCIFNHVQSQKCVHLMAVGLVKGGIIKKKNSIYKCNNVEWNILHLENDKLHFFMTSVQNKIFYKLRLSIKKKDHKGIFLKQFMEQFSSQK